MTISFTSLTARRQPVAVAVAITLAAMTAYLVGSAHPVGAATGSGAAPAAATLLGTPLSTATAGAPTGVPAAAGGITVDGSGTAAGTPDTLLLSMSVTAGGGNVSTAFAAANSAMAAVQRSLREHGTSARDMKTSDVSLQTRYTNKGAPDGFTVSEGLTATLRSIRTAGAVISAAVIAGGPSARVDSVSLDLSDTGPLVNKARDGAFAAAKAKAEQYARDAGRPLGPVQSITEQATPSPERFFGYPAASTAAPLPSVPIQPGSQSVSVTVTVRFSLG